MGQKKRFRIGFYPVPLLVFFLILSIFPGGCGGGGKATQEKAVQQEPVSPDAPKIAVLPFRDGTKYETTNEKNICFLTKQVFRAGDVLSGSGILIGDIFRNELSKSHAYVVIPDHQVDRALFQSRKDIFDDYSLELGQSIGRTVHADTVLMGVVMRYERRVGTSVAISQSASVAFSMLLLNVETGDIWWEGRFEKTQEPLLSNLLDASSFFKGGMKWQEAKEMSKIGIQSMMSHFPQFHRKVSLE